MHVTKWKKPIWKGYILLWFQIYDILVKAKLWKKIKRLVVAGVRVGERWIGRAQGSFREVKILCMILWWWIYVIIHLSNLTECTTPRMNLNVNYGLWVLMMCQCMFICCNKCTALVGMLIMEDAMHVWRQGAYGKSLYLPFNFDVNLKLD